jgi:signal transduction histidine kinase
VTAVSIDPSRRRWRRPPLRVQLTVLYAGLFILLVTAVLAVSGLLRRQGTTNINGSYSSHTIVLGQHFDAGPLIVAVIAVIFAVGLAWWIAGRFLRPLRAMNTAAREISATNLHRRLRLDGPADELTELGRTLDDLFGRLEASFEAQRHFIANASHELRTPLAGLQTLLEVTLSDPHAGTEALRSACQKALALGQHQERLVNSLLTLATSERGVEVWEPLDLAQITETILTGGRHEADDQKINIQITANLAAAPTAGDPKLVELLVANLIDNALRHNTTGGTIEVSTLAAPGRSTITVTNTGPTVLPSNIERLFQPFQQAGTERVGHTNGHGFGLAIVGAIAKAHHAKITAHPQPHGGLDIAVAFDSSRSSPPNP